MVAIETNQNGENVVAVIGRFMPPHNGHKEFLINFARDASYKKVIVMIGSAYTAGTERYCIPATEREKMLRAIFKRERIPEDRFVIPHVADTLTFEDWIYSVRKVCKMHGVTHFCTGNREDILDVLASNGETLGFEMINPEENSNFPYHATDIRRMIISGKYDELKELIPEEIFPILFRNTFKEISAASENHGIFFVPGRQTVDLIFIVRNTLDGKVYVLLGKRSKSKVDFPGYVSLPGGAINEFESPIYAAIRNFYEETGLRIKMLDNSLEPAIVKFENIDKPNLEQMFIVGIYSSEDEILAGTRGGSSQCFGVFVEDELPKFKEMLKVSKENFDELDFYEISDAFSQKLAYQHGDMLKKAVTMFSAYPDLIRTF